MMVMIGNSNLQLLDARSHQPVLKTKKPIPVKVTFEEDKKEPLALSDFSFLETQELLKDFRGSFSDKVIEEKRKE